MAGLIAARGHGADAGALGIAPKARILPVRYTDSIVGATSRLPEAIRWAAEHGAGVISMSFGMPDSPELEEAITVAQRADVVLVAAVGNRPNVSAVEYPAAYPGVIAAAGVDRNGDHAAVSVTGPQVVLSAPAVDIVTTDKRGQTGYRKATGTSDATAIIAGAAALVRARFPTLSAAEVVHRLTATARDRGPRGRDEQYGFGVLDVVAALTATVPPPTASAIPTAAPTGPAGDATAIPPARQERLSLGVTLVGLGCLLLAGGGLAAFLWHRARRRRAADDAGIGVNT